jgi:hypothetical protein
MAEPNQEHLNTDPGNQAHIPNSNLNITPVSPLGSSGTTSVTPKIEIPSLSQMLNGVIANSQDKYSYTKQYSFNPETTTRQSQNFERYYESPGYEKLGFNPWGDNETTYNENTSGASDLWRATKTSMKLAAVGFMSPLRSYADIFTGDPLSLDYKSSREMGQLNTIGSSTRGGVAGFSSNLVVNSGYTVGIVAETLLEEAVLTLALPETGGASGALMVTKGLNTIQRLEKFYTAAKGLASGVKSLKDFNKAKIAFDTFKSVGKFINPLENTLEAVSVLNKSQNLTSLAKAANTAGAFYRDIRAANLVLSEAKMEGASVTDEIKQNLVDTFYKENNRMPNLSEIQEINKAALEAGNTTMYYNIPTIFLTNKVTFDGPILKGFKPLAADITINGIKVGFQKGVGYSLTDSNLKNVAKSLIKPKMYGKAALNYFKGNFMEGIQESSQEIISGAAKDAAKDYYTSLIKNKGKQGLEFSIGSYLDENFDKQFSGQGFETFASGFFMGGLIGSAQHAAVGVKNRIFTPEGYSNYSEYKKKKAEFAQATVDKLNDLYKDPLKYFGAGILNFSNATESQDGKQKSELAGDNKSWQDFDDIELWGHISNALETGTYDNFLDQIKDIRKMDPQSIKDAYNLNGEEVLNRLNKIEDRAAKIKQSYDYWTERAPNPFNPRQYKKGTIEYNNEAIAQKAWEESKKQVVAYNYSTARNIERMQSLTNEMVSNFPVKDALSSDFTILTSPQDIRKEISMLKADIKATSAGPMVGGIGAILKEKKNKLEALTAFEEAHKEYLDNPDSYKNLKKAYTDYIKALAKNHNAGEISNDVINNSFVKLVDVLDLDKENKGIMKALNLLSDPVGFKRHYGSLFDVMSQLYDNREAMVKESVMAAMDKIETNAFLKTLYERGFILDAQDADNLLTKNTFPEKIFNVASKEIITQDDPRYNEVVEVIQKFIDAQNKEEDKIESSDLEMLQSDGDVSESLKLTIVDKLRNGLKLSVNERTIYNKLKDEIDLRLEEIPEEVIPTELVGDIFPEQIGEDVQRNHAEKLKDKLQAARSIQQLDDNYKEIENKLILDSEYISTYGRIEVDALYKNLREGMKNSVSFDDIDVDDIIMLEGGESWIVFEKENDYVKATQDTSLTNVITIPKSNFKNSVIMKIDKDMDIAEQQSTITEDQQKASNESLLNREDVLIGDRDEIERLKNTKTKEELAQDFINDLGCK